MEDLVKETFPLIMEKPIIESKFIEENPNILEISEDIDFLKVVPSYMLWVLKYKDKYLVDDWLIDCLAEFGRSKNNESTYLNFKYLCNHKQIEVVIEFLEWCKKELIVCNVVQIDRSLKNWRDVINQ